MARIVVVEDDVYMRDELIDILAKAGYDAIPLLDIKNVITQIKKLSPDLILLDINLPFQSGFEICKEIKSKQLGTVLILTARDKLQDELHALGLGADDYLTKPCNMERLLARTKNLLRRLYLKDYASYIRDGMVSELTELNRNMMLSIDIIPIPTDEAVREVENRLLGVETNISATRS